MHRQAFFWGALLLSIFLSGAEGGDTDTGAAALDQCLVDLSSDLRAACLAARAEDVDWATLAYLRRAHGVRTAVICFSRTDVPLVERAAEVGAGVYRLNLPENGFSRSAEETLAGWQEHNPLEKLGSAIRVFLPDLLLVSFRGETDDGRRGAVETLARQTFGLAPTPDFQVSKLYFSCEEWEATAGASVSKLDPVRGVTYTALAGAAGPQGHLFYRLEDSHVTAEESGDLFTGLAVPRPQWLDPVLRLGSRTGIRDRLFALLESPPEDGPSPESVHRALVRALGLGFDLAGVSAETGLIALALRNGGDRSVELGGCTMQLDAPSPETREIELTGTLAPGEIKWVNLPHVSRATIREKGLSGTAAARVSLPLSDLPVVIHVDFSILPEPSGITMRLRPWGRLIRPEIGEEQIYLEIENRGTEDLTEPFSVSFQGSDRVSAKVPDYVTVPAGRVLNLAVTLEIQAGVEAGDATIECRFGAHTVRDLLKIVNVGAPGELMVGVVASGDGDIFQALVAMGMRPNWLTDEELLTRDLLEMETIVVEPGAYESRPALGRATDRLIEFVNSGGNLVVFQPSMSAWRPSYAPYKLEIGGARVSREDAPIQFPDSDHRLLQFPNRIEESEFEGWLRERGRDFPASWDEERFTVVLETADPGFPLVAGLLTTRVNEGHYTLTSLAWQRQLRNLNPAALKMLANLVALPIHR